MKSLVAAVILFSSPQGAMQYHAEVPRKLCGLSEPVAMTPAGSGRVEGRLIIRCSK